MVRVIVGNRYASKQKKHLTKVKCFSLVRLTGLEPARRETLDPKSSASTNSATGATPFGVFALFVAAKVILFIEIAKLFAKKLFDELLAMSRHDDVVIADGIGEEIAGGKRLVGKLDDLLRATEVGLRFITE